MLKLSRKEQADWGPFNLSMSCLVGEPSSRRASFGRYMGLSGRHEISHSSG